MLQSYRRLPSLAANNALPNLSRSHFLYSESSLCWRLPRQGITSLADSVLTSHFKLGPKPNTLYGWKLAQARQQTTAAIVQSETQATKTAGSKQSRVDLLQPLSTARAQTSDPLDLLESWESQHKSVDIPKSNILQLYRRFTFSSSVFCEDDLRWEGLQRFLVTTTMEHGFSGISRWAIKGIRYGYGHRVIQVWDQIASNQLRNDGIMLPEYQKQQNPPAPAVRPRRGVHWRFRLEADLQASLFFTAVIWAYACKNKRTEPFHITLARLLHQTWVKPLSSLPLIPFENGQSLKFGKDKIETLIKHYIPNKTSRILAKRFVAQVDLAQIGWPDLEGWCSRILPTLGIIMQERRHPSEWSNLYQVFSDACREDSGSKWVFGSINRKDQWAGDLLNSHPQEAVRVEKSVVVIPQAGILPHGARPRGLDVKAICAATSWANDTEKVQIEIMENAERHDSVSGSEFWYRALEGAARSGNLQVFDSFIKRIKSRGYKVDTYCQGYHFIALLNSGNVEKALSTLNQIKARNEVNFGVTYNFDPSSSHFARLQAAFPRIIIQSLLDLDLLDQACEFLNYLNGHRVLKPSRYHFSQILNYLSDRPSPKSKSKVLQLLDQLDDEGIPRDIRTCTIALQVLGPDGVEAILGMMEQDEVKPDGRFWATVCNVMTQEGRGGPEKLKELTSLLESHSAYDDMEGVAWSVLIQAHFRTCSSAQTPQQADELFNTAIDLFHSASSSVNFRLPAAAYRVLILGVIKIRHRKSLDASMEMLQEFYQKHPQFFEITRRTDGGVPAPNLFWYLGATYRRTGRMDLHNLLDEMRQKLPWHVKNDKTLQN